MPKARVSEASSRSPTEVDRIVGENIRRTRLLRNKTLSDLAGDLGISHQQLQKYETAANRLSAGMLDRVARALGVPIASFFQKGEEKPQKMSVAAGRISTLREEGRWLLEKAGSEQHLKEMVDVLRVLASRS